MLFEIYKNSALEFPDDGERRIIADAHDADQAFELPVLGDKPDASADRVFGAVAAQGLSEHLDFPGVDGVGAENRFGKLRTPRTDQPENP